jgi:hypothetical protein
MSRARLLALVLIAIGLAAAATVYLWEPCAACAAL